MMDDYYMMWLSRIPKMTQKKAYYLLRYFGSPLEVWKADKNLLSKVRGLDSSFINDILSSKDEDIIKKQIKELEDLGVKYVSVTNNKYPSYLKTIYEPPLGLYIKGELPKQDDTTFSIIGARVCSEYGKTMAYRLAKELAEGGFTIVSGMARGIDSMSHEGAIAAAGKTIAILGFGHNHCYPPENLSLMRKIEKNGCLISEYPPDTPALSHHFPQRNRIISGISKGILVIEAGKRSGTFITVDHALDNGRTVFTLPANVTSKFSEGSNQLIKEGCPIVTNAEDIFFELRVEKNKKEEEKKEKINYMLATNEKTVYDLIGLEPISFDEIVKNVEETPQDLQYLLTMLEIRGFISKLPGERYIKSL